MQARIVDDKKKATRANIGCGEKGNFVPADGGKMNRQLSMRKNLKNTLPC